MKFKEVSTFWVNRNSRSHAFEGEGQKALKSHSMDKSGQATNHGKLPRVILEHVSGTAARQARVTVNFFFR